MGGRRDLVEVGEVEMSWGERERERAVSRSGWGKSVIKKKLRRERG